LSILYKLEKTITETEVVEDAHPFFITICAASVSDGMVIGV
jgi:hypothetical protein